MGKKFLARALAEGYRLALKEVRASEITKAPPLLDDDIGLLMVNINHGEILLCTDIDGLRAPVAEVFPKALEQFVLDIVVGRGATA